MPIGKGRTEMYMSRFDQDRFRERIEPCHHLASFCRIEAVDKEYLGYRIAGSLQKSFPVRRLAVLIGEGLLRFSTALFRTISIQKPQGRAKATYR